MEALASFAVSTTRTAGRLHPEPPPSHRSEYQRDRDRIVHSSAFRRLEYKTQVFVNHEGDMFRTRLTHTMEVAQIARTIARSLALNEELTEAIALAHDLGHTPFGHAGQHALNECMRPWGGFEHNLHSLRIVDILEERYAAFDGLNLTLETREGILKHCNRTRAAELGEVGRRFLNGEQPHLEAQVTNIADEIAYNNHDIDDGLRAGLITLEQLMQVELFATIHAEVTARWPGLPERRARHEVIRRMINRQVVDLIESSRSAIAGSGVQSVEDVRRAGRPLIVFGAAMREQHRALKTFLREHLYQHYRVHRMAAKAQRIVQDLFNAFMQDPRLLPVEARERIARLQGNATGEAALARGVADYLAGMTDRYAIAEYRRIFEPGALT